MKKTDRQPLPSARKKDLVVQELSGETLVYDLQTHQAFCLNKTAALVWKECNGRTPVPEISQKLSRKLKSPVNEAVVWYALERLDKAKLMGSKRFVMPPAGRSRRQMIRNVGLGALIAVPTIMAIASPSAANAASCIPKAVCAGVGAAPCNSNGPGFPAANNCGKPGEPACTPCCDAKAGDTCQRAGGGCQCQ